MRVYLESNIILIKLGFEFSGMFNFISKLFGCTRSLNVEFKDKKCSYRNHSSRLKWMKGMGWELAFGHLGTISLVLLQFIISTRCNLDIRRRHRIQIEFVSLAHARFQGQPPEGELVQQQRAAKYLSFPRAHSGLIKSCVFQIYQILLTCFFKIHNLKFMLLFKIIQIQDFLLLEQNRFVLTGRG